MALLSRTRVSVDRSASKPIKAQDPRDTAASKAVGEPLAAFMVAGQMVSLQDSHAQAVVPEPVDFCKVVLELLLLSLVITSVEDLAAAVCLISPVAAGPKGGPEEATQEVLLPCISFHSLIPYHIISYHIIS